MKHAYGLLMGFLIALCCAASAWGILSMGTDDPCAAAISFAIATIAAVLAFVIWWNDKPTKFSR